MLTCEKSTQVSKATHRTKCIIFFLGLFQLRWKFAIFFYLLLGFRNQYSLSFFKIDDYLLLLYNAFSLTIQHLYFCVRSNELLLKLKD